MPRFSVAGFGQYRACKEPLDHCDHMHLTKGLAFRVVVVTDCDEDVLPLDARIEHADDGAETGDIYETERCRLHVACTRAPYWFPCLHRLLNIKRICLQANFRLKRVGAALRRPALCAARTKPVVLATWVTIGSAAK